MRKSRPGVPRAETPSTYFLPGSTLYSSGSAPSVDRLPELTSMYLVSTSPVASQRSALVELASGLLTRPYEVIVPAPVPPRPIVQYLARVLLLTATPTSNE